VVHAHLAEAGAESLHLVVSSRARELLIFYAKIWEFGIAQKVFDRMSERSVVAWNAMISGCARQGKEARAVELFDAMHADGLQQDQFTFASVPRVYARLAVLEPSWPVRARRRSQVGRGQELLRQ
jgi:pentatricopeptide repeat protein